MRFFSMRAAREDLREAQFAERPTFEYAIAFLVLQAVMLNVNEHPSFNINAELSMLMFQIFVASVPIVGTCLILFSAYGEGGEPPFFPTYFTPGWVAMMYALVFSVPFYGLHLYFVSHELPPFPAVTWFTWVIAFLLQNFVFFSVLYVQIRKIAKEYAR